MTKEGPASRNSHWRAHRARARGTRRCALQALGQTHCRARSTRAWPTYDIATRPDHTGAPFRSALSAPRVGGSLVTTPAGRGTERLLELGGRELLTGTLAAVLCLAVRDSRSELCAVRPGAAEVPKNDYLFPTDCHRPSGTRVGPYPARVRSTALRVPFGQAPPATCLRPGPPYDATEARADVGPTPDHLCAIPNAVDVRLRASTPMSYAAFPAPR